MEIEGWWFWRKKCIRSSYMYIIHVLCLCWRLCEHETNVNMHLNITMQLHDYLVWKLSAQLYYFLHKKYIWFISFSENCGYGKCTCRSNLPASYWNLPIENIIQNEIITVSVSPRNAADWNYQWQNHYDLFRGESQRKFCLENFFFFSRCFVQEKANLSFSFLAQKREMCLFFFTLTVKELLRRWRETTILRIIESRKTRSLFLNCCN